MTLISVVVLCNDKLMKCHDINSLSLGAVPGRVLSNRMPQTHNSAVPKDIYKKGGVLQWLVLCLCMSSSEEVLAGSDIIYHWVHCSE